MLSKLCSRLLPLVFVLALSLIALPAHAARVQAARVQHPSGHYTHQIDWAHPFRVYLPGPGMPRSGIGPEQTGGIAPNISITPNANFPTNCYNNYAYNVIVQGQTTWTFTNGIAEAWVQYQWCPQYNGDAVGINWAYGRDYPTSGCLTFEVGNGYGARLSTSSDNNYRLDGENTTDYNVCSGNYVWDYSLTAIGSGLYSAYMTAIVPNNPSLDTSVASPCCY